MNVLIVGTPLFDANMTVLAYRLCARSGETAIGSENDFRRMSGAFESPGLDLIEQVGLEPFAGDAPLFADINRFQLMTGIPTNLQINPEKLICTLPGNTIVDEALLARCGELKALGYHFALDQIPENGMESPLLPLMDYVILDYYTPDFGDWRRAIKNNLKSATLIISGIPNPDVYQALCSDEDALFSGAFYSLPITKGISRISPVKTNALQLLKQVNEQDFELQDVVKIVERDPYLTISLLQFINSAAVGLSRKVGSIQNAVAILGQKEVRRWAIVAISVNLAEDRPGEITKLSLVRAKFAENLAMAFELGLFQSNLFIAGLFSVLDVILQRPMESAISQVAVDEKVRQALVEKTGPFYPVLDFIYTYEHADWDKAAVLMRKHNIDAEAVNASFVGALSWYQQLLSAIDGKDEPDEEQENSEIKKA